MTSEEAMKTYYATRAPYYDDVYEQPERREDIARLRQLLGNRFAGRQVVEVACGTGYWSQHIAPVAAGLVATDALTEPLEVARQRPACAAVRFRQVDAYALPPDLGRFDAAFAGLWLSHVPVRRRRTFFASLHRVLQPGARVVLIDNSDVQCARWPIVETDADGDSYQQRQLKDGSSHRVLKNFPTEAELVAMTSAFAENARYEALQNFWLFEYTYRPDLALTPNLPPAPASTNPAG
jgi:demethylmenaquinone methyltransferase/2-methoxy-6-polyprenyl-1,4-benzoquinol methylase